MAFLIQSLLHPFANGFGTWVKRVPINTEHPHRVFGALSTGDIFKVESGDFSTNMRLQIPLKLTVRT